MISTLQDIPMCIVRYAVAKHKYKLMVIAGTLIIAPLLPIGLHSMYSMYKFTYRSYYLYSILSAIQSSSCNWISTPSVMFLNALINYAFDPDTANDIIKGIYWLSCKAVQSVQFISGFVLQQLGGTDEIKQKVCNTIYDIMNPQELIEPDFNITFGKTDYDFIDIYITTDSPDNPQDKYDLCNQPIVVSNINEDCQNAPFSFELNDNYMAIQ